MKRLKHPRCCRRGKCVLVGAVTAFVPPNIHLRRGFFRALQIHWEMGIQPLWHHHQQQGQIHCVPSSSSAAGSENKTQHKQQLMGKRPPEFRDPIPSPKAAQLPQCSHKKSQKLLKTRQTAPRIISMEWFYCSKALQPSLDESCTSKAIWPGL